MPPPEVPTVASAPPDQGTTVSPSISAGNGTGTPSATAVVFEPLVTGEESSAPMNRRPSPSLFLVIGAVALLLAGGLLVFIRRQF